MLALAAMTITGLIVGSQAGWSEAALTRIFIVACAAIGSVKPGLASGKPANTAMRFMLIAAFGEGAGQLAEVL